MNKTIASVIEAVSRQFGVSGGAMIAIRHGEVILKECFGYADVEAKRPVTENSIFDIASDSKCFTTMLVSTFCEEGLLDWDKPFRTWWPEFHLGDEYTSSHLTMRDMASQRSGICSHNLIRQSTDAQIPSRAAYIERVQNLPMTYELRERFMYQNELYGAIGCLLERLTGKTYEELITERIAKPLGMEMAFRGLPDDQFPDIAQPYYSTEEGLSRQKHNSFWQVNPCGGLRTNIRSLEKWLRLMIAGGVKEDGTRLVSEASFKNLYQPNSFWCDPTPPERMRSYGLGLCPSVYRGELMVYHGGAITGFRSSMNFFPEKDCGYFLCINSDNEALLSILRMVLADLCLDCLQDNYDEHLKIFTDSFRKSLQKPEYVYTPITAERAKLLSGTWWNDAYHELLAEPNDRGGLTLRYGQDHGDIFEVEPGVFRGRMTRSRLFADCRFAPDGKTAAMSFCEFYTPTPFRKL